MLFEFTFWPSATHTCSPVKAQAFFKTAYDAKQFAVNQAELMVPAMEMFAIRALDGTLAWYVKRDGRWIVDTAATGAGAPLPPYERPPRMMRTWRKDRGVKRTARRSGLESDRS